MSVFYVKHFAWCWTLFCNLCLMFSLKWSSCFDASQLCHLRPLDKTTKWVGPMNLSHVKNQKLHIKVQTANRLARSCKNLVATVYAKAKVYALHLKPLNLAFVILSFFSLHLLSFLKPFSLQGILSFCWLKYFCQQIHPKS